MGELFPLDVVSRFVHVFTAIVLVGGSVFSLWFLPAATAALSKDEAFSFQQSLTSRWKRAVHLGILLFLMSGFYNYWRAIPLHRGDGVYHALVGTKILLALAIFFIASALVGRSPALSKFRENRKRWLTILVVCATIVVGISSFAKVRGAPTAPAQTETTAES